MALARLLANLGGESVPAFNTPDKSKVSSTNEDHPAAQCRLDTYFAGAVCNVDWKIENSQTDANVGTCSGVGATLLQLFQHGNSAFSKMGARPGCWYSDSAAPAPLLGKN
jgi:hypothetical protein